jgi:hypothetical protein
MCRNIKPLFNYDPPSTDDEISASALQYVRKVSGFRKPSKANEAAFAEAVKDISRLTRKLIESLETAAPPKNRAIEIARAKAKAEERFAKAPLR